ncbi:MAG: hypothetical protein IT208_11405 [Chthonomonadales bacterium]|nr:hypothetical protein [Chthonomonadales bacterium]
MSSSLQEFMAAGAIKAAADLETALNRIPDDKRGWSPAAGARSALDQLAECALLGGQIARLVHARAWPADYDPDVYERDQGRLADDETAARSMLHSGAAEAAEAIRAVPDADLAIQVELPWGPMALAQIIAYPYWNTTYHEGQINYIASILGCLE